MSKQRQQKESSVSESTKIQVEMRCQLKQNRTQPNHPKNPKKPQKKPKKKPKKKKKISNQDS